MDEFIECIAEGGDADAFVAARRPAEPDPPASAPSARPDSDPDLTRFAYLAGCPDYLDVSPLDIHVLDLDPGNKGDWDADQWVRAYRSGFMTWLHIGDGNSGGGVSGLGAALRFHVCRDAAIAAASAPPAEDGAAQPCDALDLARLDEWTEAELARAWTGGLLLGLSDDVWERLAEKLTTGERE